MDDFEAKIDATVKESARLKVSCIAGIPPWVQHYFNALLDFTGKSCVLDIFPNLSLYVYGGVNFAPYAKPMKDSIGADIACIETYPASEGFIAYSDHLPEKGLRLMLSHGMFYEFIPMDVFHTSPQEGRISLEDVQLGVNYALVLNTHAGLFGYVIGDTIRFLSLKPYKIMFTGRTKHFISAFGEHVIAEEIEQACTEALAQHPEVRIVELTVAPQVAPKKKAEKPYHEWFIEFSKPPKDNQAFIRSIDRALQTLNPYYKDLRQGAILGCSKMCILKPSSFRQYMRSINKLHAQNKVPRLSDNRNIADKLIAYATA